VAQHPAGGTGAQPVGVLDPLAADQGGVDKGHGLVTGVGRARRITKVDALIEQLAQQESLGQAGGQDQASVRHRMVVIKVTAIVSGPRQDPT
jgi:hypothetical protein